MVWLSTGLRISWDSLALSRLELISFERFRDLIITCPFENKPMIKILSLRVQKRVGDADIRLHIADRDMIDKTDKD